MKLKDLLKKTEILSIVGDKDIEIQGIAYDSRRVQKGFVFVAIPGTVIDGAKYIPSAISNGAVAVCHEGRSLSLNNVTEIIVPSARKFLADISCAFYDEPSKKLKVVGITGTNGKTTTAYLINSIFGEVFPKTGLISTIETKIGGKSVLSTLTTPESLELQKLFYEMLNEGVSFVAMEVSSHSIAQKRIRGIAFDCAVFTNLTHDHLDYHLTMENYFNTKLKLFSSLGFSGKSDVFAVVNTDDDYGEAIIEETNADVITYSLNKKTDIRGKISQTEIDSMEMEIGLGKDSFVVKSNLTGIFNAYNILAATACAKAFGIEKEKIIRGIEKLQSVPGRMQFVNLGQNFKVIVDFAHSPDSLSKALDFLNNFKENRLIVVFGCTGDRDKIKRPLMGEIAAKNADFSIITSDDPHNEDPISIIKAVEQGFTKLNKLDGRDYIKIIDRREAINKAISIADEGDIILIAGRGHEKFQEIKGVNIEIDDYMVAKESIQKKFSLKN